MARGSITLAANTRYDVLMEYFNGTGGAATKLFWTPPGDLISNAVPTDFLFLPSPGSFVKSGVQAGFQIVGNQAADLLDK